ncbi:MAG: GNAT family N-acetyltransferase [Acidobacteria bacterium]|nr:GNAT family N-acetyltransferase [Acidobacteriota bacterium]
MRTVAQPYQLVETNLRHAMEFYARVTDSGQIKDLPGVEAISCGRNYPVFNSALLRTPAADTTSLAKQIAAPTEYFNSIGMGWSCWLCHDLLVGGSLAAMNSTCASFGMEQVLTAPGMLAEALRPPDRRPPKMEVREVNDPPSRLIFAHLVSIIFELPFQMTLNVYGHAGIWEKEYAGYIAFAGGKPIAIVMLNCAGDCAGFYSVGTVPGHRRQGYAESLMRIALELVKSRWTFDSCVLQSSSAGRRLYEKMGFREVTRFSVFRSRAA